MHFFFKDFVFLYFLLFCKLKSKFRNITLNIEIVVPDTSLILAARSRMSKIQIIYKIHLLFILIWIQISPLQISSPILAQCVIYHNIINTTILKWYTHKYESINLFKDK